MAKNKLLSLNVSQVLILKTLAHYEGEMITRERLEAESGAVCDYPNLGPVYTDTKPNYPGCLWSLSLVDSEGHYETDSEGREKLVTYWKITDKGMEYAKTIQTRRKSTRNGKIPARVIDPVAIAMKKTRTYGFESYSIADLEELRSKLPEKWQDISDDDLKSQLANRRKQGAFADKVEWPKWYQEYRETPEFKEKEEQCLEYWHGRCVVNQHHPLNVVVVHRVFECEVAAEDGGGIESILYREEPTDLIPLCEKCRKRMEHQLQQPPATEPDVYGLNTFSEDQQKEIDTEGVIDETEEVEEGVE